MKRFGLLAVAISVLPLPVLAQQLPTEQVDLIRERPQQAVAVKQRSRPDFEPRGLRAGTFLIYPKLLGEVEYNDNIFADRNDADGDFLFIATPSLRVQSDWEAHALNFRASTSIGRYKEFQNENYEDYRVGLGGRYDLNRELAVVGDLSYAHLHETRGSRDDVAGRKPTEFDERAASVGLRADYNRVFVETSLFYRNRDFDDVQNSLGQTINNDDRDVDEYGIRVRGTYQVIPRWKAILGARYSVRDYDAPVDDSGVDRDSDGWRLDAGFEYEITPVSYLTVTAGYETRDYDDPRFSSLGAVALGADLEWNITGLTTIRAFAEREIEDVTTVSGGTASPGVIATQVGASVEHELLRNLILEAKLTFTRDDFEDIAREDDTIDFGVSAEYLLNPNLHLGGGYFYRDRDVSNSTAADDYQRNLFRIWASTQF